jgi:hypothetical protein
MDPFWTLLDSFGPTFKDTYQFVCLPCDYITSKKCNFEKHKLTAKHLRSNLDFQKVAKKVAKHVSTGKMISEDDTESTDCDDKKVALTTKDFPKMAKKVAREENGDDNDQDSISKLNCHYCLKKYMSKSGLRKHMKCCIKPTEINTTDLIDIINKDKTYFIFDEIDSLINPLKSDLNIYPQLVGCQI